MRQWNRLSLTLPLGLAVAALYVPLRLVWAANSTPTAIEAALQVDAGEITPHFFTGDTRLSRFQRLAEQVPHTLQPTAVTAAPSPNADQRPVEPPRPELAPATINAVSTMQVPPPSPIQPQLEQAQIPATAPSIAWDNEQPLDAHFFPRQSPVQFAAAQQETSRGQPSLPIPRLRATEIQSVGAAQVAIAPAPPAVPQFIAPAQNANPYATTLNPPVAPTASSQPQANFASFSRLPTEQSTAQAATAMVTPAQRPDSPPAELLAPQASTVAFENKSLHGPHYFAGSMQLTSLERQPQTNSQLPSFKGTPPTTTMAQSVPALPPAEANQPQIAAAREPVRPQPTSVLLPSPSRPNPNVLAKLPSPARSTMPFEYELTSLAISGPEPIKPLLPAEVLAAASPPPLREEFRLTSLQGPIPGVNLQPTEVLPIPSPFNPTAPRVPTTIDAERPIGAVSTNITDPSGRMPTDLAIDRFRGEYPPYLPRDWEDSVYFWDAPSMCIGPLRYEEVNLERYGYSHCPAIQPVLSGMRFLVTTMALPYSLAARPLGTCEYPLGHYRPGSPVPFRHIRPELRPWPASAECMAVAGLILLIP